MSFRIAFKSRSVIYPAAAIALLASLALAGCGSGSARIETPPEPTAAPGGQTSKTTPKGLLAQKAFASCDAVKDYYSNSLAEEFFTGYTYNRNCFSCDPAVLESVDFAEGDALTAAPGSPQAAPDRQVSETNTQEVGVDEADLIETNPNGTEIYVLRRFERELLVIDTADTSDLKILSRTTFGSEREPAGMFFDVASKRLAVILNPYYPIYYLQGAPAVSDAGFATAAQGSPSKQSIAAPSDFEQGTQIQFFDVSDPASQPQLLETFTSDGQYVNARRIGSRIHLITQYGFPYPSALANDEEYRQLAYEDYRRAYENRDQAEMQRLQPLIRARIKDAVNAMSLDELLPQLGTDASGQNNLACNQIERPDVDTRLGLLLISSINSNGSALNTLGTINNSWQIYASSESLYLLQTSGGWWFDQAQKQQTAIYRYDISSGNALPGAVGLVDGWINNSYQLSEFNGSLRVAATEGRANNNGGRFSQHSHMHVLNTVSMNTVGEVRDFVPVSVDPNRAESIRSARFLGDRGYVVTFEQTDPLFSFDLSNPAAPFVAGYVEIPGFSTYIHPLDDDHLLTIGRAAGEGGRGTGRGYQLQIFDVSDPANPASIAQHEPDLGRDGYAYSLAEQDPHAFTYAQTSSLADLNNRSGLLSIPVQISSPDQSSALSGFIAYNISVGGGAASIDEYVRIDHKDTSPNGGDQCPPNRSDLPPEGCNGFAPVFYNEPLRSVIITETGLVPNTSLLTMSSAKLKALDASGPQGVETDTLEFNEQ